MVYPHKSIESYEHKHRIGVLVEFGMDSEYTSRVPEVRAFMTDIALHIAACSPNDIESLLNQDYVKDPDRNVLSLLTELREFVSEEVTILRFVRWEVDENLDNGSDAPDPPRSPANVIRIGGMNR